jgi:hypothetical protein
MTEDLALTIWALFAAFFGVGFLVGASLIFGLFKRIDPLAAKASWYVKLLWLPGLTLLWPLFLWKLLFLRRS